MPNRPRLLCTVIVLSLAVSMVTGCASRRGYPRALDGTLSSLAVMKSYTTHRVSSEDRAGNFDFFPLDPGQTRTLALLDGPGEITHIWMTISSPDPQHLRNLVLRVYYDGLGYPSVESPVGDFFGLGHGRVYTYNNLVQAIGTTKGMNSFWPMPFKKSARIDIANDGPDRAGAVYYYVDWRKLRRLPRGLGYFHAQYRQDFPCPDGKPYLILDTEGAAGHYVGCNLSIHTQSGGWWGEGDDIFTIDGEVRPSMWGTGSEDYFCGAWCYNEPFYNLYFGMPYREKLDQSADNHWNVYRYHFENPIPFRRAIKVEIEHGSEGFNNTRRGGWNNDYSSVAYWYMKKPVGLKGSLVPASERASAFRPRVMSPNIFEIQLMDGCTTPSVGVEANPQALDTFVQGGRYNWLLGDHVFCHPNVDGSVFGATFTTSQTLAGDFVLRLTQAPDYGRIQVRMDDEVILPDFNGFYSEVRPVLIKVGARTLEPGPHTIHVVTLGKDERSKNNLWGFDYLRIGGEALKGEDSTPVVAPSGEDLATPQ